MTEHNEGKPKDTADRKAVCRKHLEAFLEGIEASGMTHRFENGDDRGLYESLLLAGKETGEEIRVDAIYSTIGEEDFIILQLNNLLVPSVTPDARDRLSKWAETANLYIPLGSIVLFENDLLLKYSLVTPTGSPLDSKFLQNTLLLFTLERLYYTLISLDLAEGRITLEAAVARLTSSAAK